MKKTLILCLFLALVSVSSCDFVRKLAGRPTSVQLEELRREQIAREEARFKALADSMAAREAFLLDSLSQANGTVVNPSKLGGLFTTKLEARYYIIVGAFRGRYYAERKLKACNEAGYRATIISFRNGLLAVGICPSDNLDETVKKVKELRGQGVCPKDSWILVNE